MILVGKSVPNRNIGIFCKFFDNALFKASVFDTVIYSLSNISVSKSYFLPSSEAYSAKSVDVKRFPGILTKVLAELVALPKTCPTSRDAFKS